MDVILIFSHAANNLKIYSIGNSNIKLCIWIEIRFEFGWNLRIFSESFFPQMNLNSYHDQGNYS